MSLSGETFGSNLGCLCTAEASTSLLPPAWLFDNVVIGCFCLCCFKLPVVFSLVKCLLVYVGFGCCLAFYLSFVV